MQSHQCINGDERATWLLEVLQVGVICCHADPPIIKECSYATVSVTRSLTNILTVHFRLYESNYTLNVQQA